MTWVSWRQQRTETAITAGLLVLLAAVLIPTGIHLASLYEQQHLARCVGRQSAACQEAIANFATAGGILRGITSAGWFNLLPGMIGVALAAPLIHDVENGTTQLAWTQSVTRRRWIATRLTVMIATALAAAGVLILLFTWYRGPLDYVYGRLDTSVYDVEGIVPFAYVVFALGVALAVGVVWRRTAPSIVVGFVAFAAARVFVDSWLRQRFVSPLSATWAAAQHGPPFQHGPNVLRAWVLFVGPSNRAGHPFFNFGLLPSCDRIPGGQKSSVPHILTRDPHCMAPIGAGFFHEVWQPDSRFWEFQGIEFALFGGLAALLIAFAAWRVLRAD